MQFQFTCKMVGLTYALTFCIHVHVKSLDCCRCQNFNVQIASGLCWRCFSDLKQLDKLDMCLRNTDAPGGNKVKIWQNL